jgi:hypothetical protein
MSSRRKYKLRADHTPVDNVAVVSPELPTAEPQPQSTPPSDDDALVRAAAATRHAEELQRQHAHRQQAGLAEPQLDPEQRRAIDAHIDGMSDLTEHKRRFLKSHPSLMTKPYNELMKHAYMVAKHAGVPDDTAAMDNAILAGVVRDIEHHHALSALTSAHARPTPENAQAHHDIRESAAALQQEAEGHLAEMAAENPPPPPPAPRRTIPVSAPVSRDAPMPSGQRFSDSTKIHLSKEEREIANSSYKHLPTKEERELAYARAKGKMLKMKANGEIQGDG